MTFQNVVNLEKKIADFFGSNYAVATDCCTHAIELCLRHTNTKKAVSPFHTYISIPFTFKKLGIDWSFVDDKWKDYYWITENIIDAAVHWSRGGYVKNTFMCLSFQYKKHFSLGRGGSILTDNYNDYVALKKMSYDGRLPNIPWTQQDIDCIGYHYYMTPETAKIGLDKIQDACSMPAKKWTYKDYPDLSKMAVFR